MNIRIELPYPFEGSRIASFSTEGMIDFEGRCLICSNKHLACTLFERAWTSATYRWDRYEDLNKMKCPSCGARVPRSFETRLLNFLKESGYDHD